MKLKLWQFEWDFDKDDAKIAVPLLLLGLGLAFTPLNKTSLLAGAVVYYLLYFFFGRVLVTVEHITVKAKAWLFHKCPWCKSRDVILQGYQGYKSDEQYAYHTCNECGETSILVNERLIKAQSPPKKALG
jgi:hypothetical protein